MRNVVAFVALASLTMACTHRHQVRTPGPLPEDEVSHGRGALEGAGLGLLAGAAGGAVVGLASGDDPPCADQDLFCLSFSAGDKAAILGLYGAGVGALAGLVIGGLAGSHDVYERDDGPQLGVSASPGGASATASWSF